MVEEPAEIIPLSRASVGSMYIVCDFSQQLQQTGRRLEALGMTRGSELLVLNAKGKGTLIVRLRDTRWALGAAITQRIFVVEKKAQDRAGGAADE